MLKREGMDFFERFLHSLGVSMTVLSGQRAIIACLAIAWGVVAVVIGLLDAIAFVCNCKWPFDVVAWATVWLQ